MCYIRVNKVIISVCVMINCVIFVISCADSFSKCDTCISVGGKYCNADDTYIMVAGGGDSLGANFANMRAIFYRCDVRIFVVRARFVKRGGEFLMQSVTLNATFKNRLVVGAKHVRQNAKLQNCGVAFYYGRAKSFTLAASFCRRNAKFFQRADGIVYACA